MTAPVLVTGAGGWLGRRLVRALGEDDATLRLLAHGADEADALASIAPAAELQRGDLRDPDTARALCAGAEGATLFHLAGLIHPPRRTRDFDAVNARGSEALLAAAERAGLRRVVLMSSNSPVGVSRDPAVVFDEDTPCRPYLGYGRSKLAAERAAAACQARGRVETVVVRAPWFYGPGQPLRQTRFFQLVRRGRFPLVAGGRARRSLAYVDDLCQALLRAARVPGAAGRCYWIADRRPYPMHEIVETVTRLLRDELGLPVAARPLRLPGLVADAAELADRALQACGLYQQELHVLGEQNKTIACSVARAEAELGHRPTVDLEEGMRRSLAWCVEQGVAL